MFNSVLVTSAVASGFSCHSSRATNDHSARWNSGRLHLVLLTVYVVELSQFTEILNEYASTKNAYSSQGRIWLVSTKSTFPSLLFQNFALYF